MKENEIHQFKSPSYWQQNQININDLIININPSIREEPNNLGSQFGPNQNFNGQRFPLPQYIPSSFPSSSSQIYGQVSPFFPQTIPPYNSSQLNRQLSHPPLPQIIPPSFPPSNILNGQQSNSSNSQINQPSSQSSSLLYPQQSPHYIPPSNEVVQYIRNNSDAINPRNIHIRSRSNNKKISELLEDVQITEEMQKKFSVKECNICLDEFKINDNICFLPCLHFFHSECIKSWIKKSNKCPLCLTVIKFD